MVEFGVEYGVGVEVVGLEFNEYWFVVVVYMGGCVVGGVVYCVDVYVID